MSQLLSPFHFLWRCALTESTLSASSHFILLCVQSGVGSLLRLSLGSNVSVCILHMAFPLQGFVSFGQVGN